MRASRFVNPLPSFFVWLQLAPDFTRYASGFRNVMLSGLYIARGHADVGMAEKPGKLAQIFATHRVPGSGGVPWIVKTKAPNLARLSNPAKLLSARCRRLVALPVLKQRPHDARRAFSIPGYNRLRLRYECYFH